MAEDFDLEGDGLNFDELDSFDSDPFETNADRSPVESITTGAVKGVLSMDNAATVARNIKDNALPKGYSATLDTAGEAIETAQDVYHETKETLKAPIKSAKSVVHKHIDRLGFLPKSIRKKIKDLSKVEEGYQGQSEEQIRDANISSSISSIFDKGNLLQAGIADNQNKIAIENQKVEATRFEASTSIMQKLLDNSTTSLAIKQQIDSEYHKKSLETSLRSMYALTELVTITKGFASDSVSYLTQIGKNTALPDALKIQLSEVHKQMLTQKVVGGVQEKAKNFISGWTGNFRKNIKTKAGEFTSGLAEGITTATDMAEMLGDNAEMAAEMGEDGLANLSGSVAKGALNGVLGRVFRAARDKLGDNVKVEESSDYLQYLNDNKMFVLKDYLENNSENPISKFFLEAMPSFSEDSEKVVHNLSDNATDPADFDHLSRRTLIEIIPGYQAKQLAALHDIRDRTKGSDEIVYDVESESFMSSSQAVDNYKDRVFNSSDMTSAYQSAERLLKVIDPDNKLSERERFLLITQITTDANSTNSAFNLDNLKGAQLLKGEKELQKVLDTTIQDLKDNNKFWAANVELSAQSRNLGEGYGKLEEETNKLSAFGSKQLARDAGLLTKTKDGKDTFDHDLKKEMFFSRMFDPKYNQDLKEESSEEYSAIKQAGKDVVVNALANIRDFVGDKKEDESWLDVALNKAKNSALGKKALDSKAGKAALKRYEQAKKYVTSSTFYKDMEELAEKNNLNKAGMDALAERIKAKIPSNKKEMEQLVEEIKGLEKYKDKELRKAKMEETTQGLRETIDNATEQLSQTRTAQKLKENKTVKEVKARSEKLGSSLKEDFESAKAATEEEQGVKGKITGFFKSIAGGKTKAVLKENYDDAALAINENEHIKDAKKRIKESETLKAAKEKVEKVKNSETVQSVREKVVNNRTYQRLTEAKKLYEELSEEFGHEETLKLMGKEAKILGKEFLKRKSDEAKVEAGSLKDRLMGKVGQVKDQVRDSTAVESALSMIRSKTSEETTYTSIDPSTTTAGEVSIYDELKSINNRLARWEPKLGIEASSESSEGENFTDLFKSAMENIHSTLTQILQAQATQVIKEVDAPKGFWKTAASKAGRLAEGIWETNRKGINLGFDLLGFGGKSFGKVTGFAGKQSLKLAKGLLGYRSQDIYIEDEPDSPIILARELSKGIIIDSSTGDVLKTIGEITDAKGDIFNSKTETVLCKHEDISKLFVKNNGKPVGLIAKGFSKVKSLFGSAYGIQFNILGKAFGLGKKVLGFAKRQLSKPMDVYVKGETEPRLLGRLISKGAYACSTGKFYHENDITGEVYDQDGNLIIAHDELPKLVNRFGHKVGSNGIIARLKGIAGLGIKTALGAGKLGFKAGMLGVNLGKSAVGSVVDKLGSMSKTKDKLFNIKQVDSTEELSNMDESLISIYAFLEDRFPMSQAGNSDKVVSLLQVMANKANAQKATPFGDNDGDGIRDGSYEDQVKDGKFDTNTGKRNRRSIKEKVKSGFNLSLGKIAMLLGGVIAAVKSGFGFLVDSFTKGAIAKTLGKVLGGSLGGSSTGDISGSTIDGDTKDKKNKKVKAKKPGRIKPRGKFGKLMNLAKMGGSKLFKVGKTALSVGRKALPWLLRAGSIGLRVLTGPVGLALTVAELGYMGYKAYNSYADGKEPKGLDNLRMYYYGADPTNGDHMRAIRRLEEEVNDNLKWKNNQPDITENVEYFLDELKDDFNIDEDNQEQVALWTHWFKERFIKVYTLVLMLNNKFGVSKVVEDVSDKLDVKNKRSYVKALHNAPILRRLDTNLFPWVEDHVSSDLMSKADSLALSLLPKGGATKEVEQSQKSEVTQEKQTRRGRRKSRSIANKVAHIQDYQPKEKVPTSSSVDIDVNATTDALSKDKIGSTAKSTTPSIGKDGKEINALNVLLELNNKAYTNLDLDLYAISQRTEMIELLTKLLDENKLQTALMADEWDYDTDDIAEIKPQSTSITPIEKAKPKDIKIPMDLRKKFR